MINLTKKQLQEFAAPGRSVISGPFGSNIGKKFFQDTGIPIIRGNNLTTDHKKFKDDGFAFLTQEKADELRSDAIMGDILFTAAGTIGQVGMIPKNAKYDRYVISNKQIRFRVDDEKADPEFIYYWLASPWIYKAILNRNTGSTVPLINLGIIKSLPISIPNKISDQKKIANIFSSIDKKIELNKKINTELEAMAKLIYDYWFVQFDFPDANGKPYKSSGGKMIYNEALKREIPKGWEDGLLKEWIKSDKTGDWGKETEQGNYKLRVDCIRGADINGLNGKGKVKSPNRFILEKNQHKLLSPFDLIIEISGGSPTQSTGRMAFLTLESFQRFKHPLICSNFCKAISLASNHYFYNFVYQWNALYDSGALFGWEGKTSGIKNFLFDSFVSNYKVCRPPESLATNFSLIIEPIQKKKQKALKENAELESLRDWLLPMLMNGQVTVKDTVKGAQTIR
jgi:type I restriction enzyme S subunit